MADYDKYLLIFSVEEVNRLAREGMPFRDAYKKVGLDIEAVICKQSFNSWKAGIKTSFIICKSRK